MVDLKATNAALAMIWDPDTAAKAHAAGMNGIIDVAIGGSRPDIGGPPVEVSVRVAGLSDGQFHCTGPMFKGMNIRLGPCALLHITEGGAIFTSWSVRTLPECRPDVFLASGS